MRQLGVVLLLVVSCLAPAMACVSADAGMTAAERACCRAMAGQCGQMGMPASHGCCQKMPRSVHDRALKANAVMLHPVVFSALRVASFEAVLPVREVGWVRQVELMPPESPPGFTTVLRI